MRRVSLASECLANSDTNDANGNLRSAGSFSFVDDTKPRVVNLDFPTLPTSSDRAAKLAENGLYKS